MSPRPPPHAGLRHVALFVENLEACERFYVDLIGLHVEWRPDPDNVYLSSGHDNLALHRGPAPAEQGARSFYCLDPAGNWVQIIFHPPLAGALRPPR